MKPSSLQPARRMHKIAPLMMDAAHAFTFGTKVMTRPIPEQARAVLARYRMEMRRAERYVLDDDAVRLICELSHEQSHLNAWSFLARIPFDVCWFEFSLHAKLRKFEQMGVLEKRFDLSEVPERAGYLFMKDDPTGDSARWVVISFAAMAPDGDITPGLIGYVYDPEGSDYDPVRGSKRWRQPTLSLRPNFPKVPIRAQLGKDSDTTIETICDPELLIAGDLRFDEVQGVVGDKWTVNRMAVIPDPFWMTMLPSFGHSSEQIDKLMMIEVREEAGHLRWLMTMLAAINNLPKDVRPVHTKVKQKVGMHILPYFQHHTITLKLPRDNRVVWARELLERCVSNAPRAWHRVSGYWRIVERGKALPTGCRHLPTMVENGLGMCERCQLVIRWIKDHERGDPTIGIVNQCRIITT